MGAKGRTDDRELAHILATFVGDRIDELRGWALELDEKYAPPARASREDIRKDIRQLIRTTLSNRATTTAPEVPAADRWRDNEVLRA